MSPFLATIRVVLFSIGAFILAACSAPVSLPTRYALVYGISDYGGATFSTFNINSLQLPDDDADDMSLLLQGQGYTVTTRTDGGATAAAFRADLANLAETVEPDDIVLIYFAGHGFGDGMEEQYSQELLDYFASLGGEEGENGPMNEYLFFHRTNGSADMDDFVATQSITDNELAALVDAIPARQKVVIIDACHAGGFIDAGSTHDTAPSDYQGSDEGVSGGDAARALQLYFAGDGTGSGIGASDALVLAASGEREFTWEDFSLGNGVFTYFLMESASTGDRNQDGYITVSELYYETRVAIADYWNTRYSGSSKFIPRTTGAATDFVLFTAP